MDDLIELIGGLENLGPKDELHSNGHGLNLDFPYFDPPAAFSAAVNRNINIRQYHTTHIIASTGTPR